MGLSTLALQRFVIRFPYCARNGGSDLEIDAICFERKHAAVAYLPAYSPAPYLTTRNPSK